jgi:dephospho-CoA kinase
MNRDGLSREEALKRIEAQLPVEEKKRFADFLVDTSGSLAETESQADEIWDELLSRLAR